MGEQERRTALAASIFEPSVLSKVWNVDDFAFLERSVGSCGKGDRVAESPSTYTQAEVSYCPSIVCLQKHSPPARDRPQEYAILAPGGVLSGNP